MIKSLYRSEIDNSEVLQRVLDKIKAFTDAKAHRFVVKIGQKKYEGRELAAFALDPSLATGTIELDPGPALGITAASVVIQGLTFTAKQVNGYYANDTTIEYVDPGADGALSVAVIERKIIVTLAYATGAVTSTADDVKAAIEGDAAANALVAITGSGAVALAAAAETPLAGGSSLQTYDKADIIAVVRLRSRRWAIKLNPSADPAA